MIYSLRFAGLPCLIIIVLSAMLTDAFSKDQKDVSSFYWTREDEIKRANVFELPDSKNWVWSGVFWSEIPSITYAVNMPFQWVYSSDLADYGGLLKWCELQHSKVISGLIPNSEKIDLQGCGYYFVIARYQDSDWHVFQAEGYGSITQLPYTLYVFNGKVWDVYNIPYDEETQYLAADEESEKDGRNHYSLKAVISVPERQIASGENLRVDVKVKNISDQNVYIPSCVNTPIQLAIIDESSQEVIRPFINTEELGPGWFLKSGESIDMVSHVDSTDLYRCKTVRKELIPGRYKITLFDLGKFGYPTLCKPAFIEVEGQRQAGGDSPIK